MLLILLNYAFVDGLYRGKKLIELKNIADQAVQILKER